LRVERRQVRAESFARQRDHVIMHRKRAPEIGEHKARMTHGGRIRADEREAILGFQHDRREPGSRERLGAADAFAIDEGQAFADQHERDMRHLRKIGDADRAPAWNAGKNSAVQRFDERAEHGNGNTRAASRHARRAREHRRSNAIFRQRRADPDSARADRRGLIALLLVRRKQSARYWRRARN
jgi:hypothetical protein